MVVILKDFGGIKCGYITQTYVIGSEKFPLKNYEINKA